MGYVLLWIECLAGSLLLATVLLAMIGRLRRGWWRNTLATAAVLLPFSVLVAWTLVAAVMRAYTDRWFLPAVILTACYFVGAVWLWLCVLRRPDEAVETAAAGWPRCKLEVCFGGVVVAAMATVWLIDIEIQQRLLEVRAEARALALSVAPPTIPDAENAALIYAEAFEALGKTAPAEEAWIEKWNRGDRRTLSEADLRDPDLESFLRSKTPALALLRDAASMIDCDFGHPYFRADPYMAKPEFQDLRDAARILHFNARWNASHDKIAAAIEDIHALSGMAEHAANEPLAFDVLLATLIDDRAFSALCAVLANANTTYDDLANIHWRESPSYQKALQRVCRMEEVCLLGVFCDIGLQTNPNWLWSGGCGEPLYYVPACEYAYPLFLLEDDLATARHFWRGYDRLLAIPYHQSKIEYDRLEEQRARQRAGPMTHMFVSDIAVCAEWCATADARRRVARAALAAAKFQAEERDLPESLDGLVPDFLLAVPFDPFDGKPLKMKRTARGIVIYSIGPDATDDGGKPFDEAEKTGDITFELPDRKQPTI